MFLSIIIPFYNEKENLPILHKEIIKESTKLKERLEIIYVDDGSRDGSLESLLFLVKERKNIKIKIIVLRKNFGQTAALAAGIKSAKGDYFIFLDSDLQNDPKDISKMLEYIRDGYDAVFGWRKVRKDGFLRTTLSYAGNWIIRALFRIPLKDAGCTLKIVKKELLENIQIYGEAHRIMSVIIYLEGIKSKEVPVNHRRRYSGVSKYNYSRIIKLLIDLMTAMFLMRYGAKPAYVFGFVGIMSNAMGILLLFFILYDKTFIGSSFGGELLFLLACFFFFGIQFIFLGLLAEMQTRMYFETHSMNNYQIRKIIES